jgi:hypothetical protein
MLVVVVDGCEHIPQTMNWWLANERQDTAGADKSAMGTINRPLHCLDARLPTTNSYTRICP